ncbi:sodium:solute symporter [Ichthyobacterium seriolicida]|uniref:Sodium/iodide co-transporter n=1 Tax=Ichthyobacterium seriolicida TaxID=242600 RepID=A0A1J1E234_9FLAO|nr:sodium:solute symporter [Ichthyobacterium seriolicida]BAV94100.1 sodium/iodide co-transporter [Ichthyobacterium seriolicida]
MEPLHSLYLIVAYFLCLIVISFLVKKKDNSNSSFFIGDRKSPWYVVAFGMIGASLSGISFVSVPGWVEQSNFSYVQMIMGYLVGYLFIGTVLMPMYYKLKSVSIYSYLGDRFGQFSYKTATSIFIIAKTVIASFRLFLAASILQILIFEKIGIDFYITAIATVVLIWLYTFRSGIKTIVWTDALQTFFMLLSVIISIYVICKEMNLNTGSSLIGYINDSPLSKTFYWDSSSNKYFWKQFLSGIFIAIAMTGLDQDMMQKNISCKNIKDAQKNMFWFCIVLIITNLLLLSLGVLLTDFALLKGMDKHNDELFISIANRPELGLIMSSFFILGLISSAYSSIDSAITSLTTSFSVDFIGIYKKPKNRQVQIRILTHIAFSFIIVVVMLLFRYTITDSIIKELFVIAGYTYGPLLGLYFFGLFTSYRIRDKYVPFVALTSPVLCYILKQNSMDWFNYSFGFELLILNGMITFTGLWLLRNGKMLKKKLY